MRGSPIESNQEKDTMITSSDENAEVCGNVDGRDMKEVCCSKNGQFVTIQLQESGIEPLALEIADIGIMVGTPKCPEEDGALSTDSCKIEAVEAFDTTIYDDK